MKVRHISHTAWSDLKPGKEVTNSNQAVEKHMFILLNIYIIQINFTQTQNKWLKKML